MRTLTSLIHNSYYGQRLMVGSSENMKDNWHHGTGGSPPLPFFLGILEGQIEGNIDYEWAYRRYMRKMIRALTGKIGTAESHKRVK